MANRPSTPEIITVNSEALQNTIRDLLPSQNGFGSELQASNVITPIIDLTATAEGSVLRTDLQSALNFGGATAFAINNTSVALANSPGFYRVIGVSTTSSGFGEFQMSDGLSTKTIWSHTPTAAGSTVTFDLVFWLDTGITLNAVAGAQSYLRGSTRQIADSTGEFVNPSGYPL
jgi:hypothetical protein